MKYVICTVLAFSICRPPPPVRTTEAVEQQVNVIVENLDPKRGRAVPPGELSHRTGLVLTIPEGWEAWEGLPGDIRLIQMRHTASDIEINLYRIVNLNSGEVPVRRPDCEWLFNDTGRHALVPALRPARVSTCIGENGNPMVVQVWVGEKQDADFAVEVVYPNGEAVGGRNFTDPVLSTIRWR